MAQEEIVCMFRKKLSFVAFDCNMATLLADHSIFASFSASISSCQPRQNNTSSFLLQNLLQNWSVVPFTKNKLKTRLELNSSFTKRLQSSPKKRSSFQKIVPCSIVNMTAIGPFAQSFFLAIIQEISSVQKEQVSLLKKIQFSLLKLVCLLGFFSGRWNPRKAPVSEVQKALYKQNLLKISRASNASHFFKSTIEFNWSASRFALYDAIGRIFQMKDAPLSKSPRVVVVIPVYTSNKNAVNDVWNLIRSFQKQTVRPYQVILVDDASPVPWLHEESTLNHVKDRHLFLRELSLKEKEEQLPVDFTAVFLEKNSGPALARNCGILEAIRTFNTQIICFVDSDCIVGEKWVESITKAHVAMENDGKVVPIIFSGKTQAFGNSITDQFHDHFGTLNGRVRMGGGDSLLYGPTCNLSIRVCEKFVKDLGAFDVSFPDPAFEDVEFCIRAQMKGYEVKHLPEAVVKHNFQKGIKSLFGMFKKYGASENLLLERYPGYMEEYGASYHIPG